METNTPPNTPGSKQPIGITQIGVEALEIRWDDGTSTRLPLVDLRRGCACANCRAEREERQNNTNPFKVLGAPPSAEPQTLEQVGNYALGITWKDGHYSIFAFDLMLQLAT